MTLKTAMLARWLSSLPFSRVSLAACHRWNVCILWILPAFLLSLLWSWLDIQGVAQAKIGIWQISWHLADILAPQCDLECLLPCTPLPFSWRHCRWVDVGLCPWQWTILGYSHHSVCTPLTIIALPRQICMCQVATSPLILLNLQCNQLYLDRGILTIAVYQCASSTCIVHNHVIVFKYILRNVEHSCLHTLCITSWLSEFMTCEDCG